MHRIVPTSDPSRLVPIAREHPDCNWAVETGNGLLVFEVNSEAGSPVLRHLCQNEWDWRETCVSAPERQTSSPSITPRATFVFWATGSPS